MKPLKRIGFYGISGVGKTTLLRDVQRRCDDILWVEGAKSVLDAARMPLDQFKRLPEARKQVYRAAAIDYAWSKQRESGKHLIIDGHLIFAQADGTLTNVVTDQDLAFYTDFIYFRLPTPVVVNRHRHDRNKRRTYSSTVLTKWAAAEADELTRIASLHEINFALLEHEDITVCVDFIIQYVEV